MIVERVIVGPMQTNCYVLAESKNSECLIIDPGADYKDIQAILDRLRLTPKFIINTHGHIDHIGADGDFKVPVYIHRLDSEFLHDPAKNLSFCYKDSKALLKPSRLLEDGDVLELKKSIRIKVIHTPGHTPGSISLKVDTAIFTGDTLFFEGVGRTDLPAGNEKALFVSIKEKLLLFADTTVIYPGHGHESTIGHEKKHNPFL
ncbi:MAG: MBL fold metallo-hydrolase [Candidatus Omnitrophota bacterium]